MVKLIRQRYILFEILAESNIEISSELFMKRLWKEFLHLFGSSLGYRAGLWLIRYNKEMKHGIIRCDNVTKEQVIAAMAFIRHIDNNKVIIHTRKTSGTVKSTLFLWKKYLNSSIPPRE